MNYRSLAATVLFGGLCLLFVPALVKAEQSGSESFRVTEVSTSTTQEAEVCDTDGDCDDTDADVRPDGSRDETTDNADALVPDDVQQRPADDAGYDDASYYICDDGTEVASAERCTESANYNNSRSDRSTAIDADTNVCDGVTCPDGSCAATAAECGVEQNAETLPPANDVDSDGDGLDDGTERANYNNSRSNRATGVGPDDGDDDRRSDSAQPKIIDNERAQDNSSSRNNNPSRAIFSDTDADGRPEVMLRGGQFMPVITEDDAAVTGSGGGSGGSVYCWGRAEDEEGKLYSWGRGICMAGEVTANASDTAETRLAALQVRGDDVRGWNEEQQAAWREFRATRATTSPEEQLVARMVERTRENERIQEITSDENGVGMQYRAEIRLFGFIPMERNVAAQATVDGAVEVDYPWYRFLSRVPEQSTLQSILSDLQALHGGGGGAGRVSI